MGFWRTIADENPVAALRYPESRGVTDNGMAIAQLPFTVDRRADHLSAEAGSHWISSTDDRESPLALVSFCRRQRYYL